MRQLVAHEPGNVRNERTLSRDCALIGELLGQQQKYDEAEPYTREALAITDRLVASHPEDASLLLDLPARLSGLASLLLSTGKPVEALAATQRAVATRRDIAAKDPGNREMRHWLSYDIYSAGNALFHLRRFAEAEAHLREAIAISSELAAADPLYLVPLQFRALYELQLADTLREQGRVHEARSTYRDCLSTVSMYEAAGGAPQAVNHPRTEADKALTTLADSLPKLADTDD
jgi:tetratricopeptide (TPR) repeat protein